MALTHRCQAFRWTAAWAQAARSLIRGVRLPRSRVARVAWALVATTALLLVVAAYSPWRPWDDTRATTYSGSEVGPLGSERSLDFTSRVRIDAGSVCHNLLQISQTDPTLEPLQVGQALIADDSQLEFTVQVPYAKVQQLAYSTSPNQLELDKAINATLDACTQLGYLVP